ncbi:unnamed protein product [Lymnaea stagnalis]|uniref:C-type lectin domain-containing protein n=1 Tax=Lymnaea stagnalis TaxID=6523 RepID=A0AAV2H3L6_LYMST
MQHHNTTPSNSYQPSEIKTRVDSIAAGCTSILCCVVLCVIQRCCRMLVVVLIFVVLGCTGAANDYGCPPSVSVNQFLQVYGSYCFEFVFFQPRDYPTAAAYCSAHGGTLALVKSRNIELFLENQIIHTYYRHSEVWIGLSNRKDQAAFQWEDGTTLNYTNWATAIGGGDSPDSGSPRCVALSPGQGGRWVPERCVANQLDELTGFGKPFVCQYPRYQARTTVATPTNFTDMELTPGPQSTVSTISKTCPAFTCDLDCGMDGFKKDGETGCSLCECDTK